MTVDDDIPDGLSVEETLAAIRSAGGVPALNWAPGKWFFRRGKTVRRLILDAAPGDFIVCDTSLRPTVWPTPRSMRLARARGLRMTAGSDPLPFPGEERQLGRYAAVYGGVLDPECPVASLRRMLTDEGTAIQVAGDRGGLLETAVRLKRNRDVRKRKR